MSGPLPQSNDCVGAGILENRKAVLEALDREIGFYRRRAGQVFFLGLLVEVLILAGREDVMVPENPEWAPPLVYSVLFTAVAAAGILLGREYMDRIHELKEWRNKVISPLREIAGYPPVGGIRLSEIEMIYAVLVFLSSCGVALVWLTAVVPAETEIIVGLQESWGSLSVTFQNLFTVCESIAGLGILWAVWRVSWWLWKLMKCSAARLVGQISSWRGK